MTAEAIDFRMAAALAVGVWLGLAASFPVCAVVFAMLLPRARVERP